MLACEGHVPAGLEHCTWEGILPIRYPAAGKKDTLVLFLYCLHTLPGYQQVRYLRPYRACLNTNFTKEIRLYRLDERDDPFLILWRSIFSAEIYSSQAPTLSGNYKGSAQTLVVRSVPVELSANAGRASGGTASVYVGPSQGKRKSAFSSHVYRQRLILPPSPTIQLLVNTDCQNFT